DVCTPCRPQCRWERHSPLVLRALTRCFSMNWRIGWAPAAALFAAQAVQAQPVGYEEALRQARVDQPVLQARELQVDALRNTAEAADELPDPVLKGGITNFPVTGPEAFDPTGTMMTMLEVGVEQKIP